MVLSGQLMFIAGLAIRQHHFTSQACLGKQFEGAIDRGLADSGMRGSNFKVQFFNTQVFMTGKENIKDNVALAG